MRRRALHVCSCVSCPAHQGSCPKLVAKGRCPRCKQQAEIARGSRQDRGYDADHDRLRRKWERRFEAREEIDCHAITCLMPLRRIAAEAPWDLGHTPDRTAWTGPEHRLCNRSAGGKAAHG